MTTIVAKCPHCSATEMTFLVRGYSKKSNFNGDVFCSCRRCNGSIILNLETTGILDFDAVSELDHIGNSFIEELNVNYTPIVGEIQCPDHVPEKIQDIFKEAARCVSAGCHNAAAAMFRLVVDMTTKSLLPDENSDEPEKPNAKQRSSTYYRLEWLRTKGLVPADLWSLADCVREDGNDAAHDGTLTADEAADIADFTEALLLRLYTEPARIRAAKTRRKVRRGEIPF